MTAFEDWWRTAGSWQVVADHAIRRSRRAEAAGLRLAKLAEDLARSERDGAGPAVMQIREGVAGLLGGLGKQSFDAMVGGIELIPAALEELLECVQIAARSIQFQPYASWREEVLRACVALHVAGTAAAASGSSAHVTSALDAARAAGAALKPSFGKLWVSLEHECKVVLAAGTAGAEEVRVLRQGRPRSRFVLAHYPWFRTIGTIGFVLGLVVGCRAGSFNSGMNGAFIGGIVGLASTHAIVGILRTFELEGRRHEDAPLLQAWEDWKVVAGRMDSILGVLAAQGKGMPFAAGESRRQLGALVNRYAGQVMELQASE